MRGLKTDICENYFDQMHAFSQKSELDLRSEYPKADFWGSILRSEQLADTLAPSF